MSCDMGCNITYHSRLYEPPITLFDACAPLPARRITCDQLHRPCPVAYLYRMLAIGELRVSDSYTG